MCSPRFVFSFLVTVFRIDSLFFPHLSRISRNVSSFTISSFRYLSWDKVCVDKVLKPVGFDFLSISWMFTVWPVKKT